MHTIAVTLRSGRATSPSITAHASKLFDLGFDPLALDGAVTVDDWQQLKRHLPRGAIAAAALGAPIRVPRRTTAAATPPRLGSLDGDEQREAVKQCRESIQFIDRCDIPLAIVGPVEVEHPRRARVLEALERSGAMGESWDRLMAERATSERNQRQFDAYLRLLDKILDAAARYERRIGITVAGLPCQIPSPTETLRCLAEFAGAPLTVVTDMVAVESCRITSDEVACAELESLQRQSVAVLAHDGDLEQRGLPLGRGSVQMESWRPDPKAQAQDTLWIVHGALNATEEMLIESKEALEGLTEERLPKQNVDS